MAAAAPAIEWPIIQQPASRRALLTAPAVANMLSPSQVNTWLDCSARWWYHYGLNLPDERTVALAIGEALHRVTAACLRIASRGLWQANIEDPNQILDWQLEEALEGVELADDESPDHIRTTARAMLRVWIEQVFPQLADIAEIVEIRMEGTIAGVRVQGTADVITEAGCIVDLKTARSKPAGVSQAQRLQLATYAMLADQTRRRATPHKAAKLITITKTKTPAAVPQTIEITKQDRQYAEWLYSTAAQQMQTGNGVMPRRSSNLCSRTNCAYWRACEAEYGGRVRD